MTPEKVIQNGILNELKKLKDEGHPIFYERRQAGGVSYKKGMPDIYMVYNGQHIEIEVKRPGGSPSTMQEKWQQIFSNVGIVSIIVDNLDDFRQFLRQIIEDNEFISTFNQDILKIKDTM